MLSSVSVTHRWLRFMLIFLTIEIIVVFSSNASSFVSGWPSSFPQFAGIFENEKGERVVVRIIWIPVQNDFGPRWPLINQPTPYKHWLEFKVNREDRFFDETFSIIDRETMLEAVVITKKYTRHILFEDALLYPMNWYGPWSMDAPLAQYLSYFEINNLQNTLTVPTMLTCSDRYERTYYLRRSIQSCILIDTSFKSVMPRSNREIVSFFHGNDRATLVLQEEIRPILCHELYSKHCGHRRPSSCNYYPSYPLLICSFPPNSSISTIFYKTRKAFICPDGLNIEANYVIGQQTPDVKLSDKFAIDVSRLTFDTYCQFNVSVETKGNHTNPHVSLHLALGNENLKWCERFYDLNFEKTYQTIDADRVNTLLQQDCPFNTDPIVNFCVSMPSFNLLGMVNAFVKAFYDGMQFLSHCAFQIRTKHTNGCVYQYEPNLHGILRPAVRTYQKFMLDLDNNDKMVYIVPETSCAAYFVEAPELEDLCLDKTLFDYAMDEQQSRKPFNYAAYVAVVSKQRTVYFCTCDLENCETETSPKEVKSTIADKFGFSCNTGTVHMEETHVKKNSMNSNGPVMFEMFCYFEAFVRVIDSTETHHIDYQFDTMQKMTADLRAKDCMSPDQWDEYYQSDATTSERKTLSHACTIPPDSNKKEMRVMCCCRNVHGQPACNSLERIEQAVNFAEALEVPEVPKTLFCQEVGADDSKIEVCDDHFTIRNTRRNRRCYFLYSIDERNNIVLKRKGCYVPQQEGNPIIGQFCDDMVFEVTKEYFAADRYCSASLLDIVDMPFENSHFNVSIVVCCDPHQSVETKSTDWLDIDDHKLLFYNKF